MAIVNYNNWGNINFNALVSASESPFDRFDQMNNNINADIVNVNPIFYPYTSINGSIGSYPNQYNFAMTGALNASFTAFTVKTFDLSNINNSFGNPEESSSFKGSLSINLDTEAISGYYTSLLYRSITTNESFEFTGKLTTNSYTGDPSGGTLSYINIVSGGYEITIKGNISVNSDLDFTGGTITDLVMTDNLGHSLNVSGASINARAFDQIMGASAPDIDALSNLITAGNDTILGSTGADILVGGKGNDTYIVDHAGDVVTELANEGTDLVKSSINYVLGANVENLTLSTTYYSAGYQLRGEGNELDNIILGDGNNNVLIGNAGNDTLDGGVSLALELGGGSTDFLHGGLGVDKLLGRDGNDFYYFNGSIEHTVAEITDSSGYDTVLFNSSISNDTLKIFAGDQGIDAVYLGQLGTMLDGDLQLNVIEHSDTLDLNIDASAASNKLEIYGNHGNNQLTGSKFNDTINAGSGNDTLNGGAGVDTMNGGAGDDTYFVDNISDIVTEQVNQGNDLIKTSITYTLALAANVENLELTGTAAINGTGNSDANFIIGNTGNNILDGGSGIDTLIGGKGNDTYIVDNSSDVVTELGNEGIDLVKASDTYTLSANVENLTLTDGGNPDIDGIGNELANTLTGNAGSNTLDGGAGVDKLIGGLGNDTYKVDLALTGTTAANFKVALQDTITETAVVGSGIDTVELRSLSGIDYSVMANTTTLILGANLENLDASATGTTKLNLTGNALANTLTGNDANNILDGGSGADILIGGDGNDTYILDLKVSAGAIAIDDTIVETNGIGTGVDSIKLRGTTTLATPTTLVLDNIRGWENIEVLDASATGSTKLNLTGNDLGNTLIGNAAANTLIGGTGDDTLNGGAGIDAMTGDDGDDTYIVDNINDEVNENASEGTDLVKASVTYTLGANVENLELTGTTAINGTGNAGVNVITGNAGNNILDGKGGNDTLIGGKGNDTYIIDNSGVTVTEGTNEGIDQVNASVSYTLAANVDNLLLAGSGNIDGTGNALANTITGNAGNNTLDGGAGIDKLAGGLGNDTYLVDLIQTGTTAAAFRVALQDTITEAANAGSDTVKLRGDFDHINATILTLGVNLENLDASATGTTRLNLTGNALANILTGNDADNILDGGAGADTLTGGEGDDTYILDLKVTGTGISANVTTFEDSIIETNGSTNGVDTIKLRGAATLTTATTLTLDGDWADIENLDASATGKTKLNLTGNSLNNTLTGNAAANVLTGGLGNDIYIVNNIDDTVVEENNEGTDLVKASVTYTLGANVENLELTGTAAINGNGNSLANIITGNAGNNILDGKGGNDTLIGGKGNDTYIIDNSGVTVTEGTNEGIDQVNASVSYTLAANVDNLLLAGSGNIDGAGNALANTITGNAGNNTLDGGAGIDKLAGGLGNDTYLVDLIQTGTTAAAFRVALQDTITEAANAGSDTVKLRGDFDHINATILTLGVNLENLDASATGTTRLNLTGNALANTLTGNDANNILDGGAGADILIGGLGNDTLKGGLGADIFKWSTSDLVTPGNVSGNTDTITDFSVTQGDKLDFKDLLIDTDHIENYIDIVFQNGATHISISSTGNFTGGIYNAAEEDAHIVLANTNLFSATGTNNEAQLIGYLTDNNHLLFA
jgi:serralysin